MISSAVLDLPTTQLLVLKETLQCSLKLQSTRLWNTCGAPDKCPHKELVFSISQCSLTGLRARACTVAERQKNSLIDVVRIDAEMQNCTRRTSMAPRIIYNDIILNLVQQLVQINEWWAARVSASSPPAHQMTNLLEYCYGSFHTVLTFKYDGCSYVL